MKKLALGAVGVVLAASAVALTSYGGWAVVKVAKIPDAWIAGKPLQLSWQVRQHGVSPVDGLRPTLEARAGSKVVRGTTWAFAEDGAKGYRGRITFPEPGEWQVTIESGFGTSRAVLIPWRVVDSVTPVRGTVEEHLAARGIARFSEVERGRRLFAAQGCVTCHVHRDVELTGQLEDYGPDLTDRRFPADYLARFLANPSIKPPTNGRQMPNLALREKEIAPLIAFINADRRAARARSYPTNGVLNSSSRGGAEARRVLYRRQ
jgi:mono/diheme cytochrome c family protein